MKQLFKMYLFRVAIAFTLLFVVFAGLLRWFSFTRAIELGAIFAFVMLFTVFYNKESDADSRDVLVKYGIRAPIAFAAIVFFFYNGYTLIGAAQIGIAFIVSLFPYDAAWGYLSSKKA